MSEMKRLFGLILASLVSLSVWADALWIDVRTPQEYAQGHVEGALLVPYQEIGQRIGSIAPDRDAEIHLYCRSGRRAGIALETLRAMGYTRVVNEGGLDDVVKQYGLPVVRE
ncbi:rhodanese-like domain-containing protein [Hahella sp. SMD15-11]|uniref:Rhodanese-like domain-containing protein n=1 Tax=Thermohahella caldifontis TaxID=3142973 RepID=A0AB39UZA6_9GAMM